MNRQQRLEEGEGELKKTEEWNEKKEELREMGEKSRKKRVMLVRDRKGVKRNVKEGLVEKDMLVAGGKARICLICCRLTEVESRNP